MAFTQWDDQKAVSGLKDYLISKGHKPEEVESYISSKSKPSESKSLVKLEPTFNPLPVTKETTQAYPTPTPAPIIPKQAEIPQVSESQSIMPEEVKVLGQPATVTQTFMNYNPQVEKYSRGYNRGVDFRAEVGTPVAVPEGEWVVKEVGTGFNNGYGNSMIIQNNQTGESMRFSHLSKFKARPGQTVKTGDVIARTGDTGNTTGPHLDLEYFNESGQLSDILKSRYRNQFL